MIPQTAAGCSSVLVAAFQGIVATKREEKQA
jgi:hypothetical protein